MGSKAWPRPVSSRIFPLGVGPIIERACRDRRLGVNLTVQQFVDNNLRQRCRIEELHAAVCGVIDKPGGLDVIPFDLPGGSPANPDGLAIQFDDRVARRHLWPIPVRISRLCRPHDQLSRPVDHHRLGSARGRGGRRSGGWARRWGGGRGGGCRRLCRGGAPRQPHPRRLRCRLACSRFLGMGGLGHRGLCLAADEVDIHLIGGDQDFMALHHANIVVEYREIRDRNRRRIVRRLGRCIG